MEIRYPKLYFSQLELIVNPLVSQQEAVNNATGERGVIPVEFKPRIRCELTGWLNNQKVRTDKFVFPQGAESSSMESLLAVAKSQGVDVIELWNVAFDKIADAFPATAEQQAGAEKKGPPVYIRPDAFTAIMDPGSPMMVIITVGVYSDDEFKKRSSWFDLVFEDGATKRMRDIDTAQMRANLEGAESILDESHPNWEAWNDDQRAAAKSQAENDIPYLRKRLAAREAEVRGSLDELFNMPEVTMSVGALCASILIELKATDSDYSLIDVQEIMSAFALPDVS